MPDPFLIPRALYDTFEAGTLEARVVAFREALLEHAATVGVPAPVEADLVEAIARSGAEIEIVEPEPPPEPEPLPEPEPEPITEATYQRAIEWHVDTVAQQRRYSSAATCASYVNSTIPAWAAEASAFVAWRDAVYVAAFAALAAFEGGDDPPPSVEQFLATLPVMVWPEAQAA